MNRLLFFFVVLFALSHVEAEKIAPTQYKNPYLYSEEKRPPILSCELIGGLGNQLFEIATTLGIAWDLGYHPIFPHQLNTSSRAAPRPVYWDTIFWKIATKPVEFFHTFSNYQEPCLPLGPLVSDRAMLHGYWQEHKRFSQYRDRILDLFVPPPSLAEYIDQSFEELTHLQNGPFVSVHIRLDDWIEGDFCLWKDEYKHYYKEAFDLFPDNATFLVFSGNSLFSCLFFETNFPEKNVVFVDESDVVELFLMAKCDHNIIVNSTFSWWGAYLNQNLSKIVVSPKEWHFNESSDRPGYLPDDWVTIQVLPDQ